MLKFETVSSPKLVVGLNTGHDWGCCAIYGDKCVAISEERLNRKKHSEWYLYALEYCLKALDKNLNDVDIFAFSSYHKSLPNKYQGKLSVFLWQKDNVVNIDHHLSHAYNTYYFSWFEKALIVVVDGLGNGTDTESYYIWDWNNIEKIWGNPSSTNGMWIGRAYESFTNYIGRDSRSAGKTMWLAAYGNFFWNSWELFSIDENGVITSKITEKYEHGVESYLRDLWYHNLISEKWTKNKAVNLASYIQFQCEEAFISMISALVKKTNIRKLCLAWGVALNGLINNRLIQEWIVDEIYVPSTTCDTWQCIWNTLVALAQNDIYVREKISSVNYWRNYTEEEILDVLNKKQNIFTLPYITKKKAIKYVKYNEDEMLSKVASYLAENKIVGRFQNWAECGARALWYRSILANPLAPYMKDYINEKVKHRESFRPFAASMQANKAIDFFEVFMDSPFMMFIHQVKQQYKDLFSPIIHVDGTCRLQTVTAKDNSLYYNLLANIEKKSGYPIVLNTSFNDNEEPIVENPADALKHLCCGNIDVLVLHNYVVTRDE